MAQGRCYARTGLEWFRGYIYKLGGPPLGERVIDIDVGVK